MIPEAHVSHEIHGRLRIKIPSRKGETRYFENLRAQLLDCPGVEEVTVNPQTASALICCKVESRTIFRYAREQQLFVRRRVVRIKNSIF
jgi:hypothetical protein